MRLRQPFSGYKLCSGHPMIHIGLLLGGQYAINYVLDDPFNTVDVEGVSSKEVFIHLNVAHIAVPVLSLASLICDKKGYFVPSGIFDVFSIFQYLGTVFYA